MTIVVAVVSLFLIAGSVVGPAPKALQLPTLSAANQDPSKISPDGTWLAQTGSIAGFRVNESFLMQSGTIVGRSTAVAGTLNIAHSAIASGLFQVDLSKLTIDGKANKGFAQVLETSHFPMATITFTQPISIAAIPTNGQTFSVVAPLALTIRGITHPLSFTVRAAYNGSTIAATGTANFHASDWGIKSPEGIHDNDVIEFLVLLQRQ